MFAGFEGAFTNAENNVSGKILSFIIPTDTQVLNISALMSNGEKNISIDDIVAVLNSVEIIEDNVA